WPYLSESAQESGSVCAFGSALGSQALGLPPTMASVFADVLLGIQRATTPAFKFLAHHDGSIFERNPWVTELPGQSCAGVSLFSAHQDSSALRTALTVPAGSLRPTMVCRESLSWRSWKRAWRRRARPAVPRGRGSEYRWRLRLRPRGPPRDRRLACSRGARDRKLSSERCWGWRSWDGLRA